jgi:prepilin-type N-terminal cleavage/methylation domain-containing protein
MRRRRSSGFTLVEVLVSLGVMTVGAAAIIGMQQQTTRANVHARQLTVATQIAQNVLERLKLEGLAWNSVTTSPATDLLNAPSLAPIVGGTAGAFTTLLARNPTNGGLTRLLSNAFDYYGQDVNLTNANAATLASVVYCASYRLGWIYTNFRSMRADVRVWWSRSSPSRTITSDFAGCADNNAALNPGGNQIENYHVVYLSTVIRPQP